MTKLLRALPHLALLLAGCPESSSTPAPAELLEERGVDRAGHGRGGAGAEQGLEVGPVPLAEEQPLGLGGGGQRHRLIDGVAVREGEV